MITPSKTFIYIGFLFHKGNLIQHGKSKENKIKIHKKIFDLTRKVKRTKKSLHVNVFASTKKVFSKEKEKLIYENIFEIS
jgi:hypothetical protein